MNTITQAALGQAVAEALRDVAVCAVFVYGSVAAGTSHPESDIDTFVLTDDEVPDDLRQRVRANFYQLQARLGYQPDPTFPVELFSVTAAHGALDTIEHAIANSSFNDLMEAGDEREILRALTAPRWDLNPGAELDRLTARAQQLAARVTTEVSA